MEIKQEFWDLIKQNKMNILLVKTIFLKEFLQENIDMEEGYWQEVEAWIENISITGRITISLHIKVDKVTEQHGYSVTINGYSIIKKEQYNKWFDLTKDYLYENEYSHIKDNDITTNELFKDLIEEDITIPYWFINNFEWIYENSTTIEREFINQDEILILNIESWNE